MYICVCNGVTDHEIRDSVREGACCMADLRRDLGVATNCGRCEPYVNQLLCELEQEHAAELV